jgi:hypothetical protein
VFVTLGSMVSPGGPPANSDSGALAAADLDALAAATADLELAGPLRITRIGATPVVPPTPPVRDLLNRLVFSLGGITAGQQHAIKDAGGDDDGASRH